MPAPSRKIDSTASAAPSHRKSAATANLRNKRWKVCANGRGPNERPTVKFANRFLPLALRCADNVMHIGAMLSLSDLLLFKTGSRRCPTPFRVSDDRVLAGKVGH